MNGLMLTDMYQDEITVMPTNDPRFFIEVKVRGEMYEAWFVNNVTDKASMMFAIRHDTFSPEQVIEQILDCIDQHKKMHMRWYMPEQYKKEYQNDPVD